MDQLAYLEEQHHNQIFAIVPRFCAYQSPCINTPANPAEKLDDLAGALDPAKGSNIGSDEAFTPPKAPILSFASLLAKDLFKIFMKIIIEIMQV